MAKSKRKTGKPAAQSKAAVATAGPRPTEGMTTAQLIAWYALLAAVFAVPIAISNLTFLGAQLPVTFDQFDIVKVFTMRACALVALAAWGWHMLVEGGKLRRTPVNWLILAFLGWVAISTVLSIHPATAFFGKYRRFEGLLSFMTYAVFYFLVLQLADRPSRIKQLAQTLFWSGIVVAGYGFLQTVGADPIQWASLPFEARRAFSTYGNPDLLGGFLMFSLPISAALALSEERPVWRVVYWGGLILNIWTWIGAYTRGAWIGGVVGFFFLGIIAWRQRARLHKAVDLSFIAVATVVALALIVSSLASPNEVMNFAKRVASIFDFRGGSGLTRTQIWQAAIDAIKDRPIFGFGADTFRLIFPKYKPEAYVEAAGYLSVADNVHDYPLQLAAGVGIPGMLLFYAIFAWAAIRSAASVFRRPKPEAWTLTNADSRVLLGGFWAACAAYITLLFFGLSVTGTSLFLWIAMAVVLSPTAIGDELKAPRWGLPVATAVALIAAVLSIFNIVYIVADNRYLMGRVSPAGIDRLEAAEAAVRLNPFNDMYRTDRGVAYTESFVKSLQEAQTLSAQGEDPRPALALAREEFGPAESALRGAIEFTPWEYDNYVFLANLYNIGGDFLGPKYYQDAIEIAKRGIEVEPFGPAIRNQHAQALIATGDKETAKRELEYAVGLDPAFGDGALVLAKLYVEDGDLEKALELLKGVEAVKPGQQGVADEIRAIETSLSAK
ncbi:MAG: O-antigen ligase family protein [Coriobacteriales bacterium]|nr:O-antigen ligase family protein [Coriobacteriales bacterium]